MNAPLKTANGTSDTFPGRSAASEGPTLTMVTPHARCRGQSSSSVASASVRGSGRLSDAELFAWKAHTLLSQGKKEHGLGNYEMSVELAYQAALRCVGAMVAASSLARKKRLPTNAWDQLRLLGECEAQQADEFQRFSVLRKRATLGVGPELTESAVAEMLAAVDSFVDDVDNAVGWAVAA